MTKHSTPATTFAPVGRGLPRDCDPGRFLRVSDFIVISFLPPFAGAEIVPIMLMQEETIDDCPKRSPDRS